MREFHYDYYSNERGNDPNNPFTITLAYTGNAAFNADGMTIHSALGIPINQSRDSESVFGIIPDRRLQQLIDTFESIKLLQADEFTYIGAHMNTLINKHLKIIKQNSNDDYGGLDMILYGDPRQLGPLYDNWIFEPDRKQVCGALVGDYLFKSYKSYTLNEIMRQDDASYINALNDLSCSRNPMKKESVNLFKSREVKFEDLKMSNNDRVDYFKENKDVDDHNMSTLKKIKTKEYKIDAKITLLGDASDSTKNMILKSIQTENNPRKTMGMRLVIKLKVNGRYYMPVNVAINDGLVNGAIGTLMDIDLDQKKRPVTLWMKFDHQKIGVEARNRVMRNKEYKEKCMKGWTPIIKVTKQFPTSREKVFGVINQFPLNYGYAFTICKSQGNNNIGIHTVVHLEKRSLMRREQYVALSRSDKLENLHIVGKFTDPWFKEEEKRKKLLKQNEKDNTNKKIVEDKVHDAFQKLTDNKETLIWTPLYDLPSDTFKISFHNVNSLMPHLSDIQSDYSTMAADVCFFLDTRLNINDEINIEGFNRKEGIVINNEIRYPGGIEVFTKDHVKTKLIKKWNYMRKDFYANMILYETKDHFIAAAYFSPKCPKKETNKIIKECLDTMILPKKTIIAGDFNQHNDIDLLVKHNFRNCIKEPTTKWHTRIDHIYINFDDDQKTCINPSFFSDHHSIVILLGNELGEEDKIEKQTLKSIVTTTTVNDSHVIDASKETKQCERINAIHRLINKTQDCWLNSLVQLLLQVSKNDNFRQCEAQTTGEILYNWIVMMATKPEMKLYLKEQHIENLSMNFKTAFLSCINKLNEWGLNSQQDAIEALQIFINNSPICEQVKYREKKKISCNTCLSEREMTQEGTIMIMNPDDKYMKDEKVHITMYIKDMYNKEKRSLIKCDKNSCNQECVEKSILCDNTTHLMVQISRTQLNNSKNMVACKIEEFLEIDLESAKRQFELVVTIMHIGEQTDNGHYICYR